MRASWILFIFLLLSCTEDDFPTGIYGYQVERLLSGGDEKVWLQVVNSPNCEDSLRLFITPLEATDSITVHRLSPSADCAGFDTLQSINANASFLSGGVLFTDSLLFADDSFWIIEAITSTQFRARVSGRETVSYQAR